MLSMHHLCSEQDYYGLNYKATHNFYVQNNNELEELGFKDKLEEQVIRLIKIADKANLYGVICSPLEIKKIKQISPNLKCFTPGIRQNENKDDQKRIMNAKQALMEGSDCLIIGRPITKGDPKKNIQEILSSIK